jgi:hypothetical protein
MSLSGSRGASSRCVRANRRSAQEGICLRAAESSSAGGRTRHAGLQPTLGDGKQLGGIARRKRHDRPKHPAVAALAPRALDRERSAEAAAVGRVCRGRNDVLAHGNGFTWNRSQSVAQAEDACVSMVARLAAARQERGAIAAHSRPARKSSRSEAACRQSLAIIHGPLLEASPTLLYSSAAGRSPDCQAERPGLFASDVDSDPSEEGHGRCPSFRPVPASPIYHRRSLSLRWCTVTLRRPPAQVCRGRAAQYARVQMTLASEIPCGSCSPRP